MTNIVPLFPDQPLVIRKSQRPLMRRQIENLIDMMLSEDRHGPHLLTAMEKRSYADAFERLLRGYET